MKRQIALLPLLCLTVLFGCQLSTSDGDALSISNGTAWTDTDGAIIQAHDSIVRCGDTYYWYGMNYQHNLNTGDREGFKSVKCYSSEDLVNWEFRNNVLVSTSNDQLYYCDITAPSVLYNEDTGKWVMWMQYDTQYGLNRCVVATCDTPYGDFEIASSSFALGDQSSVMMSLFKDDDGTGYLISYGANGDDDTYWVYIYKLNDDYLSIDADADDDGTEDQGIVNKLFPGDTINRSSMVKKGDFYYLLFSYYSDSSTYAGTQYATATSISGNWSGRQELGTTASSHGELGCVFVIRGTDENSYMVNLNAWDSDDLSESGYVWAPLRLSGMYADFDYYSTLTINATTGVVTGN